MERVFFDKGNISEARKWCFLDCQHDWRGLKEVRVVENKIRDIWGLQGSDHIGPCKSW